VWEVHFDGPYATSVLGGDWQLHGRWRYWSDPSSGTPVLQESSVGVTVVSNGPAELPQPVCIARYDVELFGRRRGRHVNVFQPVVGDKVHWLAVDESKQFDDWAFEEVLGFLVAQLPDELLRAGWPAA
jgi:hypothetical protein